MTYNDMLTAVVNDIYDWQLGKAIADLENYYYTQLCADTSGLEAVKTDFRLMSDYWQKGYDDPQREQLYGQLLRRMYVQAMNDSVNAFIRGSVYVRFAHGMALDAHDDWSAASLRRDLESYVSDVAMLELEPEHTRKQKQKEIYESHQKLMAALFDYIWTSKMWSDALTEAYEEMLLSPTIDTVDQQLIVSAITLSLLMFFDINKFRLLIAVYRRSADENVRQRALVGWVFCLNADAAKLYPEMHEMVEAVTADGRSQGELAELQMQIIYCLRAESDNRIIQSEIMPELIKNNNIRVTRNSIEEVEDDPMEDVLHPELSEQRMEKLEASMRRMADMQKQGSDIYFGGFSQMKRFPFFNTVANWFQPFFMQHPIVDEILGQVRGKKFLQSLLSHGPFCDSDKYSFLLAYQTAVSRMPASLLDMMDRGEAMVAGGEMTLEELATPAFKRRSYLQSLYRFFRVYPSRGEFVNPFDTAQNRYLFFANSLFRQTRLEKKFGEVVSFLLKHKAYDAARKVLQNYREEARDAQFYLLNGALLMRTRDKRNAGLTAGESYARLMELEPDNERAWSGYARAMFEAGSYQTALDYYHRLVERHPSNRSYQLNEAVCLSNLNQYEEALKTLYKLNYEAPDDQNVNRVLAWTLVGSKKYDQAAKIYTALVSVEAPVADDLLNYGYCLWFSKAVPQAAEAFRRYADQDGVTFDAVKEFFETEAEVIRSHGVSDVEVWLMIDLLAS